ncbi:kinase-like protein [Schizopora paradoxa]|uniref:Kinase-like protein n=1 Tax=Schizopora paradoxa TaxID=27342 RepID=A0A0H2RHE1_9AGAM|nr:kinase-like protein [Schizopora paradoxa]
MDGLEGSTWKAMVGASLELVHLGVELSGVPGLSLAEKLVDKIVELALNVPRNRNQARVLSEECESLLAAIKQASEGVDQAPETFIGKLLSEFVHLLREIQSSMVQWKDLGFWKSFAHQDAIAKNIAGYGRKLSYMKDTFNIGALAMIGYETEILSLARRGGGSSHTYPRLRPNSRHSPSPAPGRQVHSQAPHPNSDEGRYEESERQDRREAVLVFAQPDIGNYLNELEDAKDRGEAEDVRQAMGQVIEDLGEDDDLKPDERARLKQNLFLISEAVGQFPKSLRIPPEYIEFDSNQAIAGSSIYDIYKGTFFTQAVAIKRARSWACVKGSVEHILKEARNWRSACDVDPHEEYILQLIGVSFPDETCMMISRWMAERDLLTYLLKMGDKVDRRRMVRRIAKGLEILHGHKPTTIAHGHLKASNIMVNHRGDPLLGDFGLSKSLQNITGQPITEIQGVNSFRWFAPELLSEQPLISPMSDIYSFAMTVLERWRFSQLMTGEHPFKEIKRAPSVPVAVSSGQLPVRPSDSSLVARGLDNRLWALLTKCWAYVPSKRPNIVEVSAELDTMWAC